TPVLCAIILKPHTKPKEERGVISWVNWGIKAAAGPYSKILRLVLVVLLGLAAGYGIFYLLHNVEFVHELVSEQIALSKHGQRPIREIVIGSIMSVLFILTFRSMLSGSEPGE